MIAQLLHWQPSSSRTPAPVQARDSEQHRLRRNCRNRWQCQCRRRQAHRLVVGIALLQWSGSQVCRDKAEPACSGRNLDSKSFCRDAADLAECAADRNTKDRHRPARLEYRLRMRCRANRRGCSVRRQKKPPALCKLCWLKMSYRQKCRSLHGCSAR